MVLKRADEPEARAGIAGMRSIIRALIAAGIPLVFGPGAIHLPTVPDRRKWNRIDLGTADKVASAALGIVDQAERLGIPYEETRFVLLELGGAFSAALAVDGGQIVDGFGGSAGPIGARACGALDAEAAYLIGGALSKRTVFSGGALDPDGALDLGAPGALERLRADPRARDGWLALEEGAAKAVLGADRVGAGAARGARGRSPGLGARAARRARRTPGGAWRPSAPPSRSRARRAARRCWRTASRAGATRRSSRACACARRAAACSTTCGCTARSGSSSASQRAPPAPRPRSTSSPGSRRRPGGRRA